MKRFANRVTAVVVTLALAVGLGFSLAACSSSSNDKDLITKGITEMLDNFKNPTEASLSQYVAGNEAQLAQLEAYGVDYVELFQHLFKHFDYTINDVQINGDKAVVKMTVENINVSNVMNNTSNSMATDAAFQQEVQSAYQSGGEQAAMKLVFDKLYADMDASTDIVKSDVELTCTKKNGQWEPDEASVNELVSKVYGGMDLSSL